MQGSKTPTETVTAFHAAYLRLGNISAAAREVGIPVTTAWGIAERADNDPEFVEARKAIDARMFAMVEDLVTEAAMTIAERIQKPDLSPEELAEIATTHDLKSFSYANPKPAYFKGLVDLFKIRAQRAAAELPNQEGPAVVINFGPEPKPDDPKDGA